MKYLLDTNVISEIRKSNCDQNVRKFTHLNGFENFYISSSTFGELSYGVERLPVSKKKHELSVWLYSQVPQWFFDRIINLDREIFIEWGRLRAETKRTIPYDDSLLAAVAIFHNMTLITRNTKDFEDIEGIKLLNPFHSMN